MPLKKVQIGKLPLVVIFTSKPLGKKSEVAYVYPAAVNSYVGIGRSVFRLFPKVFEDLKAIIFTNVLLMSKN